jgi:hypothetical protein
VRISLKSITHFGRSRSLVPGEVDHLFRAKPITKTERSDAADIQQSRCFGEYVRIWPGAAKNKIEVIDVDHKLRQLVMRIKEARRPYTDTVLKGPDLRRSDLEKSIKAEGGEIIAEDRLRWTIQLWTPSEERFFLCGMDDLHLFVAQVPPSTTVEAAHAELKPREVIEAEKNGAGPVVRQGEWFFLRPTAEQYEQLHANVIARPKAVRKNAAIGDGGQAHIADRVIRIEQRTKLRRRQRRQMRVYAFGSVLHPDHRTIVLTDWHEVIRNREIRNDGLRLRWID